MINVPPGYIAVPSTPSSDPDLISSDTTSFDSSQVSGQINYVTQNVVRYDTMTPRLWQLYNTAQTAYWTFFVSFFAYRDVDNNHQWQEVSGPSGVGMLNKILVILSQVGNKVKLDVGTYQRDLLQVSPYDVKYMQKIFIQTYGNIDDLKQYSWNNSGSV